MSIHKEISFENEICDTIAAQCWQYAEGDEQQYGRALPLNIIKTKIAGNQEEILS